MLRLTIPILALLVCAVAVGACGGDEEAAPLAAPIEEPGLLHIHGLGIDEADGRVFIATHTGLWSAAKGETEPRRVGTDRRDVMGFTIAGEGRFLGSGHPDPSLDLPPLLGLIESRDDGQTWTPVSLLGTTDFHTLRAAGDRIYGADATSGTLYVSDDGGATWAKRRPPANVVDLAIDPEDARHVVVTTERGLHESTDAGRTWRPRGEAVGLLAWPEPDALYVVDGAGAVGRSADRGREFELMGQAGGRPAAFAAAGGSLLLALHDSNVQESSDGGRTWTQRVDASGTAG